MWIARPLVNDTPTKEADKPREPTGKEVWKKLWKIPKPGDAAKAAINMPEMLALILSHVPMIKRFNMQQVSRTWSDIVTETPRLQKLVLEPVDKPLKPVPLTDCEYQQEVALNPLLPMTIDGFEDPGRPAPVFEVASFSVVSSPEVGDHDIFIDLPVDHGHLYRRATPGPWGNFLLTQPPVTAMTLFQCVVDAFGSEQKMVSCRCTTRRASG